MSRPDRPALPKLSFGDELTMRSGTPGRRDGKRESLVRVVIVGRKYVHVVLAEDYEAYVAAEPEARSWRLSARRFLLADQREGAPGSRIGYTASIATAEQHEYDRMHGDAVEYLRKQGIALRAASRWYGHEVLLARLMRDSEPPAAEADV